jgi:hypothetical protein
MAFIRQFGRIFAYSCPVNMESIYNVNTVLPSAYKKVKEWPN